MLIIYINYFVVCIVDIINILPIIVRVIKSRRLRWAGHVARMRDRRVVYRVLMGKPEREREGGRGALGKARRT